MTQMIKLRNTNISITSDGDKVIIQYDNERGFTYANLKNYTMLEDMLNEIKNYANEALQSNDNAYFYDNIQSEEFCNKYFNGPIYFKQNMRSEEEILMYEKEASEKVWLMRTVPCDNAKIEKSRQAAVQRILTVYDDIPQKGYSDWECGYWNGVLGALRWVLGDEEKDNLDT